jgi:hypothetical protein
MTEGQKRVELARQRRILESILAALDAPKNTDKEKENASSATHGSDVGLWFECDGDATRHSKGHKVAAGNRSPPGASGRYSDLTRLALRRNAANIGQNISILSFFLNERYYIITVCS